MSDITCNVVRDLLPLYVDDVLSEDSRKIVDDHILVCAGCMDYYQKMKNPAANDKKGKRLDDKETLKKIRKTLMKKRLITAIVTAVCIAAIAGGLFYGIVVHETYIPYEEAGLYVSDETIRSDREFYKSTGIYTPDGKTLFMFMTATKYTELKDNGIEVGWPIISLTDDALTMHIEDDNGNVTEQVCREIYYLPEQKAKQLMKVIKWPDDNVEKEIENLKEISVLIWEAE